MKKIEKDFNSSIDVVPTTETFLTSLPLEGFSEEYTLNELDRYSNFKSININNGQISGSVYRSIEDNDKLILNKCMDLYGLSNILHPDMFPGINKMERELIAMNLNLFNSPSTGAGCFSMGGTESILLACRTYKQFGLKAKNITKPEMIIPVTAHAAFDKAAEYFNIELIHVETNSDFTVNVELMEKYISKNTIMIVGSCMNYPNGAIDNIQKLSDLALKYDIGLHVDCCLGGYLVPFMEEAGFPLPLFDFRLLGVTSISCDTHKYGCTIKGSSLILYRTKQLFQFQFSSYPEWSGGIYATHSLQGSRPGLLIASTWAALMKRGRKFYINQTKQIIETTRNIIEQSKNLPEIELMGNPKVSVIAYHPKSNSNINVYQICDAMDNRGWSLNKIQNPPGFHFALTSRSIGKETQFINDLKLSIDEVIQFPNKYNSSMTALYGMKQSLDGTGISDLVLDMYLSSLLKV